MSKRLTIDDAKPGTVVRLCSGGPAMTISERDTMPGYVAGAVEAMDAGDPKRDAPRQSPRWPLFVVGVMVGAVACAWVMSS